LLLDVLPSPLLPRRRRSGRPLVIVNTSRGHALDEPAFAHPADLDWVRTTLEEADVTFTIRQEVRGREAADELIDVLEEVGAELCVIGIRRRSAVGKMMLGSNAHRILMDYPARCSPYGRPDVP
jgi:nucleotide-binding universal stress UspA family protein